MPDSQRFEWLRTESDLKEAIQHSQRAPVVLYKHSATCSLSTAAQRRLARLEGDDPPVYELVVQKARDLADAIAEQFGIRHESPQAIVVYQGRAVDHASHGRVTDEFVRTTAAEATSQ